MANIQSQKKRNRQNEKRRMRNAKVKSSIRTAYKKTVKAAKSGEATAQEDLKAFVKAVDTAAGKKVYHKNTVARKKSRLARRVNAALAAQS